MAIKFITGNAHKFAEAKLIIPDLEQLDIDLPEIQELDPEVIIREKLQAALAQNKAQGQLVVEDTGIYLEALNGFPGPLIKWYLQALGVEGIYRVTAALGNPKVSAKTIVGFVDTSKADPEVKFFHGEVAGEIVSPRYNPNAKDSFAWNPIFQPVGYTQTFAEMSVDEKNKISMRAIAFRKLQEYLKT